jgi:hypothetical protein
VLCILYYSTAPAGYRGEHYIGHGPFPFVVPVPGAQQAGNLVEDTRKRMNDFDYEATVVDRLAILVSIVFERPFWLEIAGERPRKYRNSARCRQSDAWRGLSRSTRRSHPMQRQELIESGS